MALPTSTVDVWCLEKQIKATKIFIGLQVHSTLGLVDTSSPPAQYENHARKKSSTPFGTQRIGMTSGTRENTCVHLDGDYYSETPCSNRVFAACGCRAPESLSLEELNSAPLV